jgi:hypothetical protein
MKRARARLRGYFPEKAMVSHSLCAERTEQSGSRELQLGVGGDTRRIIRDIV